MTGALPIAGVPFGFRNTSRNGYVIKPSLGQEKSDAHRHYFYVSGAKETPP